MSLNNWNSSLKTKAILRVLSSAQNLTFFWTRFEKICIYSVKMETRCPLVFAALFKPLKEVTFRLKCHSSISSTAAVVLATLQLFPVCPNRTKINQNAYNRLLR